MFNKFRLKNLLNQNLNDVNFNSVNYVNAAVLIILFYKHNDINVLLTQRTHNVKTHKDQISFPGGLYKKKDKLMINTALRETSEEIGINSNNLEILGKLDNVKSIEENFLITPYVTYAEHLTNISLNKQEVKKIIEIPLYYFSQIKNIKKKFIKINGDKQLFECYLYDDNCIWGLTAYLLKFLSNIIYNS